MVKKIHNSLLFIYAFTLPFEYWDPLGLVGSFSIVRMVAILYLVFSLINFKQNFNIVYTNKFLIPLLLLLCVLVLSNLIINQSVDQYRPVINISFLQNIVIFWLISNHISSDFKLLNEVLFAFALGILLLGGLYEMGIGFIYRQGRLSIFGDNPNNQGTKVAIGICLLVYFILIDKINLKKIRFLLFLPIPILLKFLADSGSRGAIISLFLGVGLIIYLTKTSKPIIRFGITFIGMLGILFAYQFFMSNDLIQSRLQEGSDLESFGGRTYIWGITLDIFEKSPFLGSGESGFVHEMLISPIGSEKSTHNYFLYVLVTSGVTGFLFFVGYLFRILKAALAIYKIQKEYIQIVLFTIIIFAMLRTGGSLGDKSFWFFFSLIAGSYIVHKKELKELPL